MANILKTALSFVHNKNFSTEYNEDELKYFTKNEIEQIMNFQKSHQAYTKTPLHSLKTLAKRWGVEDVKVKDESYRFGLNAFKVLGGIYAIGKYLAEKLNRSIETLSFADLTSGEVKEKLGEMTFITATDGNHGRGVAWAARELGQSAVVYMPKGASNERIQAIKNEGATVKVIDGNYDKAVRLAAETADR